MCGICGHVERRGLSDREAVYRMTKAVAHRGPDQEGHFFDRQLGLGVRRLSIIDVEGGSQPLSNEDGSITLVANGEIYNYVELRAELERRGHRFRSGSDCEVIVHLYEEHASNCVQHLRGMFAFALWDASRERLLLARDRMGEKPLYFYEDAYRILFSSEMKSLLESRMMPFTLDPESVDLYFHYGFVPEPRTAVTGIRKLDAGELMTIDTVSWIVRRTRYWEMDAIPPLEGDPVSAVRAELDQIAQLVTRSDVPIAIALSGGFDSSAVASLLAAHGSRPRAITIGYPGRPLSDERDQAREFAQRIGMSLDEVEIRIEDVVVNFIDTVRESDDPVADISASAYRALMQHVKGLGLRVLLQGHGGDELFWGYDWVREAAAEAAEWRPSSLQRAIRAAGRGVLGALHDMGRNDASRRSLLKSRRERVSRQLRNGTGAVAFYELTPEFRNAERHSAQLYTPTFRHSIGVNSHLRVLRGDRNSSLDTDALITSLICKTYLRGNGLVQSDRLGMAASVEARLPLVDYRLVETVVGLRKARSDRGLAPKAWFKEALADLVPEFVANRPKRGFTPPIDIWAHAILGSWGHELRDGYLVTHRVLDPAAARHSMQSSRSGSGASSLALAALILELWCQTTQPSSKIDR